MNLFIRLPETEDSRQFIELKREQETQSKINSKINQVEKIY